MSGIMQKVIGEIGEKRRWKSAKARVEALPAGHRTAAEALERYLVHSGTITKGGALVALQEELADLFERTDGASVREIVGADPVAFAEGLLARYSGGGQRHTGQQRLVDAITRAENEAAR